MKNKNIEIKENPLWAYDTSVCYTRVGLIIMDFSIEFDTRTIWEQITCPKCKGGKVEITDYCFKCLDCDFLYCEYPTKEADL